MAGEGVRYAVFAGRELSPLAGAADGADCAGGGSRRAASSGVRCSCLVRCIEGSCTTLGVVPRLPGIMPGRDRMSCADRPAETAASSSVRPKARAFSARSSGFFDRFAITTDAMGSGTYAARSMLLRGWGASWICWTSIATACSASKGVRAASIW